MFSNPMLPDVESQKFHPRLIPFQGVTDTRFVAIQRQSYPCQPCHQQLLTVVKDCAIRVQHQTVISIGNDPGVRIDLEDGLVYPMQSDQR
jgi:hypothetical protein